MADHVEPRPRRAWSLADLDAALKRNTVACMAVPPRSHYVGAFMTLVGVVLLGRQLPLPWWLPYIAGVVAFAVVLWWSSTRQGATRPALGLICWVRERSASAEPGPWDAYERSTVSDLMATGALDLRPWRAASLQAPAETAALGVARMGMLESAVARLRAGDWLTPLLRAWAEIGQPPLDRRGRWLVRTLRTLPGLGVACIGAILVGIGVASTTVAP